MKKIIINCPLAKDIKDKGEIWTFLVFKITILNEYFRIIKLISHI